MLLKVLGVLLILVIAVGGLGYYMGWFEVRTDKDSVNIRANPTKLQEDEEKAKKKIEETVKPKKE